VGADSQGVILSRVRVLLADDHRMVAEGLKSLLTAESDLIWVVKYVAQAMRQAEQTRRLSMEKEYRHESS
jgi:DNA-binding NarL/FixJ family response regulator